ncbi:MAG: hypothetical protein ACP5U1_01755 [Desulfomonilaceae bacterium]
MKTSRKSITKRSLNLLMDGAKEHILFCHGRNIFWGVMLLGAYHEFEHRTRELTTAHGAMSELVLAVFRKIPETFRHADLPQACPNVGRSTIKRVLSQLREERRVEFVKPCRNAGSWKTQTRTHHVEFIENAHKAIH